MEAKEFVEIKQEWSENDILVTKDNSGQIEKTSVNYKEMVHWMIKKK